MPAFKPYVFISEDFGETWKSLASNLEMHYTVKAIREHPATSNLLFVGTERGAFVSMNAGGAWSKLSTPLPSVPVNDIQIHPRDNDLILATHGRGIWILDDITPLVAMADAKTTESFTLFPPRPAVEFRFSSPKANAGNRIYLAGNPPAGAIIQYFLKEKPEEKLDVKLSVWSKDGSQILSDIPRFTLNPGLNRVSWDMRFSPPAPPTDDEPLLRELTPEEMQEEEEKGESENAETEAAYKQEVKDELGFNQTLQRIFHSSALCLTSEYRRAGTDEEQTPVAIAQTPAPAATPERAAPRRRAGFGFLRGPRLMPGTYQVHFSVGKEEQIQMKQLFM